VDDVYRELRIRCSVANLPWASRNALKARLAALDRQLVMRKRFGARRAREVLDPAPGAFKGYHHTVHRSLGTTPARAWQIETHRGRSLPMPSDPRHCLLSFFPVERRFMQRTGLHVNNIRYWSDVLPAALAGNEEVNDTSSRPQQPSHNSTAAPAASPRPRGAASAASRCEARYA
jgi:hypothetical protein